MTLNNFSWKIAGEAGDGILNAGLMLARTAIRGGLYAFATAEYPSLIRGGHNHLDVRISDKQLTAHTKYVTILVALNQESVDKHKDKLAKGGAIIYDPDFSKAENVRDDIHLFPMPLMKMSNECGGKIMRNVIAMGASIALMNFDLEMFNGVLRDNFGTKKGAAVVESNIKAAKVGYDFIRQNEHKFIYRVKSVGSRGRMFLSGNQSIVAGAIKAGCKFLAAYPMTPATSIMTEMAAQERNFSLVVKHTEDEIAAINMAIGASFAGVRAMTCTSGGGFSLMVEGLGLAAQTETPIVIVESQRPGPATGMATHSGQADLRFVLSASTDEFPRIILAPGDVEECFYLAIDAFNYAERYQMPVIVMTDKYLGESYATVDEFDTSHVKIDRGLLATPNGQFHRYKVTESGISPRSIPGMKGGAYVASSYEHDEEGFEREEEEIRVMMHDKRFRKIDLADKEIPHKVNFIDHNSAYTIMGWGSTKGPILEAMDMLKKNGITVNFMQIKVISPFPSKEVEDVMKSTKTIMIENNKTSQMGSVIREHTGLGADYKILQYDGRPFSPEDIYEGVKHVIENNNLKELVFSKHKVIVAR